ncbi:hypothetical protein SORBI_3004G286351 [Sorghum bicolor]|uniref:Uncharacterized protein n=1 Tax=Sorghum bicolor TaxID=4558 RepID=A0A1Z5RPH5_SORBI|nr:hypothetical protein SORBI_3004G286351 [Sorghum bicolor]
MSRRGPSTCAYSLQQRQRPHFVSRRCPCPAGRDLRGLGKISHPIRTGGERAEAPGAGAPGHRTGRAGRGNSAKSRGMRCATDDTSFLAAKARPICHVRVLVRRPGKILTCRNRDDFSCAPHRLADTESVICHSSAGARNRVQSNACVWARSWLASPPVMHVCVRPRC